MHRRPIRVKEKRGQHEAQTITGTHGGEVEEKESRVGVRVKGGVGEKTHARLLGDFARRKGATRQLSRREVAAKKDG